MTATPPQASAPEAQRDRAEGVVPMEDPRIAELRAELAASEQRFRAAAGGLLDAFYVLEAERDEAGEIIDFRFSEINPVGLRIIGMVREQALGQRLCELLPINVERGYFEKYKTVVETGEPLLLEESFCEVENIHASWLQFQAVKVGDGVAIHTRDITARKLQEQESERLYLELQMIFNAVPSLIFYKDTNNTVLRVNEAVAEAMGMPVSQIEGRSAEELFPEEAAAYYRDDMEVLRSGKPRRGYVEPQTLPNGQRTWIRTDKSPLFDASGRPLGILAVASDITEQRESAFQAAVLEKAVEERQAMGRDLHDGIGQQLTGVRMLVEKVRKQRKRGELPDETALDEIASVIAASSTEVRRMISGLSPERISADELPVALTQVAANVQIFYGVQARCECDDAAIDLDVEAANHFLGIAQEAAINAAKHAGSTCIRIQLSVEKACVSLRVLDNGVGMPSTTNPKEATRSTGRGMQIMHHRAAAMGARLEIGPAGASRGDADGSGAAGGQRLGTSVCCVMPR